MQVSHNKYAAISRLVVSQSCDGCYFLRSLAQLAGRVFLQRTTHLDAVVARLMKLHITIVDLNSSSFGGRV